MALPATIKLFGHNLSPPSKLVAAVLLEKKLPFKFISVDLFAGEHKKPEFLKMQPFAEVPVIDDSGFTLYESRAICQYLDEKYSGHGIKLIPEDIHKRGLYHQATFSEASQFNTYAFPLISEAMFNPNPSDQKIADFGKNIAAKLDIYDKLLANQRYVAGDEFTLADLWFVPSGELLPACRSNAIQERPNVARWFKEVSGRPSWQQVKDGLDAFI